jgi:hypothetical protein
MEEPGWLSGIALGCGLDDRGFESRQGLGILSFATASILDMLDRLREGSKVRDHEEDIICLVKHKAMEM